MTTETYTIWAENTIFTAAGRMLSALDIISNAQRDLGG